MGDSSDSFFSESGFMPHGHCYLWQPELMFIHATSDLMIGLAYFAISLMLYILLKRTKIPFSAVVLYFGVFIGACGASHLMEVWTLWRPAYWLSGFIKIITAITSVGTGVYLFRLRHRIVEFTQLAGLADQRRSDLESMTKTLEARVAERTAELAQALKLREDFLSIASHELRTPVSGLKMQLQIITRRLEKNDTRLLTPKGLMEVIEICDRQTERLLHLIEDILDVSRIQTGRLSISPVKINLAELIRTAVMSFDKQFEAARMKLEVIIPDEVYVSADAIRIEQVIGNLLTNALKYGNDNPVSITLESTKYDAIMKVIDRGLGISPDSLERVFEPFERDVSHENISGLGLGLFICKQIIEAHNGQILLSSTLGVGSVFEVQLPLSK